jgi:hypothetical protein
MPLLLDASKAVQRLPRLKKFILKLGNLDAETSNLSLWPIVSRVFQLWYLKAGMHRSPPRNILDLNLEDPYVPGDAPHLDRNRVYWRVGDATIWDEVKAAWSAAAGPDAKIVFMDEDRWVRNGKSFGDVIYDDIPVGYYHGYDGKI